MEQIRLLTNLETDETKLLQLVLIGQPELNDKLALPELRQFAQRVTARYHLKPLTFGETRGYVHHRLAVAGVYDEVFPDWSLRRIHAASGGVPRLINVLCDRVLLGVYADSARSVSRRHLRRAITEVLPAPASAWQRWFYLLRGR
jgi:general secretion pathway protein A